MCSIGIDLGTTYSCVAALLDGQIEVIPDDQGSRITNSCVAFTNDGDTLVGSTAVHQHSENVINTTYDIKRLIGRKFSDASVQADMENYLYDVVDDDGNPKIRIRYITGGAVVFAPEEISAMVLREMKAIAQCYIGEDKKIESVVITVPAHFNDAQRRATKLAAEIAGIKCARMINEPTAAALAYGLEKKAKGKRNVVIYDLGGGTFDATVLTITDGCFQVKATGGDAHLGGQDFNVRLYNHFRRIFLKNTKLDISQNHNARQKLFAECERVKRLLSFQDRVEAHIPSFFKNIDFTATITRARFEHLNDDLFRGTMGTIEEVLREANLTKEEIDDVVLVGGSTRIPFVRELLSKHFDKTDLCKDINPDEAVAYGAAVYAAMSYGTIIPEMSKLSLHDVTSLSLGIEEKGFNMDFLIKRNTNIPNKASRTFITSRDDQSSIEYKIFEGERPLTHQNKYLGSVSLTNLPALPAGKVKTKLIFEIDGNGVLQVKAYDKSNPDNKKIMTIKWDKGRWSEEEIQKMIKDAEKYRVVDDIEKRILTCRSALQNTAREALQVAAGKQGTEEQRTNLRDQARDALNWLASIPDANIFHLKRKQKQMDAAFRPFKSKI